MKPEEFTHYVNAQMHQGISRDALIASLRAGGWTQEQVDTAFREHDAVVRSQLSPDKRHLHRRGEIFLWILFVLVACATILFYLGGE